MKFPMYPLLLIVFELFIFSHCENITITNSIQKITSKNETDAAPTKAPIVNFSRQNKSELGLKSVDLSEENLDASLNDSLEDIDLNENSKDFEWKEPQFIKSFQFDHKRDNASLEKLLNILTPLINLTRLDNDTKAFDWSDEELNGNEDLLSEEDEDLTSFDLKVGTYIQKISPNSKLKPLEPNLKISPDSKRKSLEPTLKINYDSKLKSLEPTLKVASKQPSTSNNASEKSPIQSSPLELNASGEVVAASSDVEVMLGESSSPMLYRLPRAASTPAEPFISRRFSVNSLRELMDYYEPLRLPGLEEMNITLACQKDMALYIEALNKRIPWALKMLDSSGHYGGSYYNGNTYWLGSLTLCNRISKHPSRVPFKLGFYTARADFEFASLEPKDRRQFVGVCLPLSCQDHDVIQLLVHSAQEAPASSERTVAISHVRTPHTYYHMVRDPLVISLVIVTAVVLLLLAAGTGLDFYVTYQESCDHGKNKKLYDNYNYAISNVGLPSNEMKMDVSGHDSPTGTVLETAEMHDLLTEMLLSFSVIRNMKQICDQSVGIDTIPTVHGFRALSMAWVILGHTCIIAFKYADNMEYRHIVQEEFVFQVVTNATFSVDTFFFISGLLVSFLYFRTISKIDVTLITKTTGFASGCLEFIGLIAYRFLRLTAPYLYVLLVNLVCMKYFYYNSVFEPPADDHVNCAKYWWRNIIYINTMFPQKDMCMLWSWYLSDDTQFYILSLVLLIVAVKYFKAAAATLVVFLVMSWVTTMSIAYSNNHMPNYDDPLSLFDKIYDKPWTRLGPYLIGISVGWILYKTDCTIKMNKLTVVTGWFLSVFSLLVMVFGVYGSSLHPLTAAAYSALSHSLWALSLAFIVIACSTGYGGYINSLLSAKYLYPFSRVTYCAYLVHPLIMRVMVMTRDSPIHLGKDIVITLFIGQLVTSYFISFFVSLAFEAPMVTMLKIISPTKRRRRLQ